MILAGLEEFGGTEWFLAAGVGIEGDYVFLSQFSDGVATRC